MSTNDHLSMWEAPRAFRELALHHFAFLVERGYTLVDDSAAPFVEFASPPVIVSVYYNIEDRDGGPDVSVGRSSESGQRRWSLGVLAQLAATSDAPPVAEPRPTTREGLDRVLLAWAEALRGIGHGLLDGDFSLLDLADAKEASANAGSSRGA
jgi:hypothetical protein